MPLERLRIAIQKSGRLSDKSLSLLKQAGCQIQIHKNTFFYRIDDLPIDLLLVRDDDITGFVSQGIVDFGIIGLNSYQEYLLSNKRHETRISMKLSFSSCHLNIAGPERVKINNLSELNTLKIATSYPYILKAFLQKHQISATIVKMHGALELAPRLKIADLICDLVSTGATLKAHNLYSIKTIMKSEAILIQHSRLNTAKQKIADMLIPRFNGIIASQDTKYIMLNAPRNAIDTITSLLPGSDAPTIMTLSNTDQQIAIHAVCRENIFWKTLEDLKSAGASSILVIPIEKMMV